MNAVCACCLVTKQSWYKCCVWIYRLVTNPSEFLKTVVWCKCCMCMLFSYEPFRISETQSWYKCRVRELSGIKFLRPCYKCCVFVSFSEEPFRIFETSVWYKCCICMLCSDGPFWVLETHLWYWCCVWISYFSDGPFRIPASHSQPQVQRTTRL